ncbi:laccase-3-like [Dendronephthya gigantea]|uniref:laccase-3-like n=1 Tax=Dendronephthya gigantea TaxID=151771 RepID=UPI00106D2837|nr:laccase-3-like [Dendronephthya gigantea]
MKFFLLLLILEASVAKTDPPPEKCFNEAIPKYVTCRPVHGRPAACNCRNIDPCYIKLIITRKSKIHPTSTNNYNYYVNGTFQGPTIIAEEKGIVVVDVFNDMDEDTSIHFHGMHQHNVPWIDGVGNITQYPIPANGKFRYIFRAFPQGTHWYHSHMRYQRDAGLFGALIVHESQRDIHERLGPFVDEPDKYLLSLLESLKNVQPSGTKPDPFCLPDGSKLPIQYDRVSFFLNGKEIAKDILGRRANESHSEYFVVPGQKYRFRVLGATKSNILIISIDYHKLHVIATDGYLVNKFTTDFLIVHVGERYDFILEAKKGIKPGTKYPINIQTLAVKCDDNSEVAGLSFAFVVYTDKSKSKNVPATIAQQSDRCSNHLSPCKILNCPFQRMPTDFIKDGTYMNCYNVRELRLLYPTPERDIPSSGNISQLSFFNFEVIWPKALINGVQFHLPDIPLVENRGAKQECIYPVDCKEPGSQYCTHTVYLNHSTTTRFVLSSIVTQGKQDPVDITHPIHMHGHTYFIAKIAYPDYYDNGTIKAPNQDLAVPKCGPAGWRGSTPGGITVDKTTVRKDVIIVPAGGYVVLEFLADNPGYWFMHCHIDEHLNRGMALAIGEAPSCASSPPTPLLNETDEFCFSVDTFKAKEGEANGECRGAIAARSLSRPYSNHQRSIILVTVVRFYYSFVISSFDLSTYVYFNDTFCALHINIFLI